MPLTLRNLAWLRTLKGGQLPDDFGARMHELITDLQSNDTQIAQQTNSALGGNPQPPPPLQSMTVTPTETGVHLSLNHGGEYYRGVEYHAEYADNNQYTNPFPVHMGPSREMDVPTGTQKLYWRAAPGYQTSALAPHVVHGGNTPVPVTGGTKGMLGRSQGSGTGKPGQGLSGYGPVPYTSTNPPTRKS